MAEPEPRTPDWEALSKAVTQKLGVVGSQSPALSAAASHGVRYLAVQNRLVFDDRALVLGLLAAGASDSGGLKHGNTAIWFRKWLVGLIGESRILAMLRSGLTAPEKIAARYSEKEGISLGSSLQALLQPAKEMSVKTVGRPEFAARHLFGAMIVKGVVASQIDKLFARKLKPPEIQALKSTLVDSIMANPELGETREKWLVALSLPVTGGSGASSSAAPPPGTKASKGAAPPGAKASKGAAPPGAKASKAAPPPGAKAGKAAAPRSRTTAGPGPSGGGPAPSQPAQPDPAQSSDDGPATPASEAGGSADSAGLASGGAARQSAQQSAEQSAVPQDATQAAMPAAHPPGDAPAESPSGQDRTPQNEDNIDEAPPTALVDGLVPFRNDSVERDDPGHDDAAHGEAGNERVEGRRRDLLRTADDVKSIADLICLKQSTPLAVAIFGGWGSGKSTFMRELDGRIRRLTKHWEKRVDSGELSPFVTRVVHIRFNAWQFVDANLWASLTAEFFDQLRAGGWERAGDARHAGLVERVGSHVHSLTTDAASRRQAAIEGGKDVQKAMQERDVAAQAAREAEGATLGQAAVDALGEIYEAQKPRLRALGLATAGADSEASVAAVVDVVRNSRTIYRQIASVARVVAKFQAGTVLVGLFILSIALAAWLFLSGRFAGVDVAALVAGIGAIGILFRAVQPALALVASIARRGGDIAQSVAAANEAATKTLLQKEIELRDKTAEAQALEQAAARADRALARYIDPGGAANPPRLLRYVLEDDPDTKSFEKEIGLIGRARRLFEAVDDIIRAEARKKPGEPVDSDVPERIVLYIDDLDRCTEQQVYNVLQAIHLLLAFRSFAVVVGVDVRWIENALAREFTAEKAPALSEVERRQHAVHYLEKIFQVAFWLDPLSAEGEEGGTFGKFVRNLADPPPVPRQTAPPDSFGSMEPHGAPRAATEEAIPPGPIDEPASEAPASASMAKLPGFIRRVRDRLVDAFHLVRSLLARGGETSTELETDLSFSGSNSDEPLPDAGVAATETGEGGDEADRVEEATEAATLEPIEEPLRTIELEGPEIEFLASPEIAALAGCTPRAVVHLVNVYRLVRSRLVRSGGAPMGAGKRPPDYPLIALCVAIETGQRVEVADAFVKALEALEGIDGDLVSSSMPLPGETDYGPQFSPLFQKELHGVLDAYKKAGSRDEEVDPEDQDPICEKVDDLEPALAQVYLLRRRSLTAKDALRIARLARRYSFNRYR